MTTEDAMEVRHGRETAFMGDGNDVQMQVLRRRQQFMGAVQPASAP